MKNTIITLASVAALAVSANAQTTYVSGDVITFNTAADFYAGTNSSSVQNTAIGFDRDRGYSGGESYISIGSGFALLRNSSGSATGTASWAAGKVADFWYDEGNDNWSIQVNDSALSYVSGDVITFNTAADFYAGTNSSSVQNTAIGFDRDRGYLGGESYISKGSGFALLRNSSGSTTGTASWAAGKVADFWYDEANNNWSVQVNDTVTVVPEPSSTALLGLGGLALILRRKK